MYSVVCCLLYWRLLPWPPGFTDKEPIHSQHAEFRASWISTSVPVPHQHTAQASQRTQYMLHWSPGHSLHTACHPILVLWRQEGVTCRHPGGPRVCGTAPGVVQQDEGGLQLHVVLQARGDCLLHLLLQHLHAVPAAVDAVKSRLNRSQGGRG